jgi:hypothetical protein
MTGWAPRVTSDGTRDEARGSFAGQGLARGAHTCTGGGSLGFPFFVCSWGSEASRSSVTDSLRQLKGPGIAMMSGRTATTCSAVGAPSPLTCPFKEVSRSRYRVPDVRPRDRLPRHGRSARARGPAWGAQQELAVAPNYCPGSFLASAPWKISKCLGVLPSLPAGASSTRLVSCGSIHLGGEDVVPTTAVGSHFAGRGIAGPPNERMTADIPQLSRRLGQSYR